MIYLFLLNPAEYVDETAGSCELFQSTAGFRHRFHRKHGEPLGVDHLRTLTSPVSASGPIVPQR